MEDYLFFDSTGDGYDNAVMWMDDSGSILNFGIDTSGNGYYDILMTQSDFDESGNPRQWDLMVDSDNDGRYDMFRGEDTVSFYEAYDYNQDGELDMIKTFLDTDSNIGYDVVSTLHTDNTSSDTVFTIETQVDLNGNHQPDQSMLVEGIDSTGDGNPNLVNIYMAGEDGQYNEPIEMTYDEFISLNDLDYTTTICGSIEATFDPNTDQSLVSGDPYSDMEHWEFQGNTGRCAIYSQKFVIEAILGQDVPIEELVDIAEDNGWFDEANNSGTTSLNMDKLLTYYNVEHEMSFDNDISALEEALNNGQKVIVSVDSGQIWYGDENNIFSPETTADHAVEVIGIDHSDPGQAKVILNDSGTPDGKGELVPLDVFENAWKAGDSQMIVCWA